MKLIKPVIIALLGAFLALSPSAPADDQKKDDKPAAKPERQALSSRVDRLQQVAQELKLTDDQKEKLKPVLREQTKKVRELRQNEDLSRLDRLGKFREIRQGTEEKIKPILTPEQLEKWKELRSEGPRRRKQE
jgi:Spy/CpxP family protein refolding chaperone